MSIFYIQRTDDKLFQGDILRDTIFHYLPAAILILREKDGDLEAFKIEDVPNAFQDGETIMARGEKGTVMIISHHCDVHNKPIIQIAPILPITKLPANQQPMCRNNSMFNYCYLPANETIDFKESYINFQLMSFYPVELIEISNRMASLDDQSLTFLHERLLWYFTRKKLKETSTPLPLEEP